MRSSTRIGLVWLLMPALALAAGDPRGATPAPDQAQAAPAAAAQSPSEPDQARIDAWLAAGRALKAERPELFGEAEGVLAFLVLPEGQGAAAGIAPGDVLVAYAETPLDSAQQLIALTGETPAGQTLTLRWLRPDGEGRARVLEASIHGGRIGVGIRDLSETPAARMQALGEAGWAARNRARYGEAMGLFRQGLALAEQAGDERWRGGFLRVIGVVLADLGRYPQALAHHEEALAIARVTGDHWAEGAAHTSLGTVYRSLGRYPEALEHHIQALAIAREIGDRAGEGKALGNLGALHAAQGHGAEALSHYRQALALQAELNEPESLWRLWNNLRRLWERESQPNPAILAGKRAVNVIQGMRATNAGLAREQQQSFLAEKEFVYRALADLLIAQGRHAEAQQVLDMLKEHELYDYIKEEGAHDPRQTRVDYNAMESEWNAAYDGIAERIVPIAQRLAELTRVKPDGRTKVQRAEIARRTEERDSLNAKLRGQLTALPKRLAANDRARRVAANARFAKAPDTKRAVLAALSERSGTRTGLLQFVLLDDKVRILLTTPEGWQSAVSEVPAKTLAEEIETLRAALTDPTRDAKIPAEALYRRLVDPIAEPIEAAKLQSLLVHLDGRLRYVPFAALNDGQRWLAERWPIVYYTAASERRPELTDQAWRVAGLGVSEKRGDLVPLPAVADEIDGIVREGDGDTRGVLPGRALPNAAFSETALKTEATDTHNRILHIASHFSLRPGSDADSSLLLGTLGAKGAPDMLSLKALRESEPPLDLRHLDLVTLSACETAMGGADDTGAEIEGMGAVIQRQGARGVLASLWSVDDASTGPLMPTFYCLRAERPELTKAQALQIAQLDLLHGTLDGMPPPQGCVGERRGERRPVYYGSEDAPHPPVDPACRWSHPYYWAPFILMGNWL